MAGISLSGMSSGLDTESMITQLMAIEAQSKTRMLTQQKRAEGRKSALEDVGRQLRALNTAVTDLKSVLTWGDTQKVTSTDDKVGGARLTGAAPAGNVTVNVTQLARVEQRAYDWTGLDKPLQIGTVKDGVTTNVDVDLTGVANATDAAAKINGTTGIGVYAGVVNNQLVLTGKKLGEGVVVSDAGVAVADDPARRLLAQKTAYTVNGVAQDETVESVVKPGGLPGVELTLKGLGTTTLGITPPGADTEKVKAKLKTFVDNYNATIDLVRNKLSEDKVRTPSVTSDFVKGALKGDAALTGMLARLRQGIQPLDGTPGTTVDTLAEIGISVARASSGGTTSADAMAGKLTIDNDKLTNVLASNPADVKKLLQGVSDSTGIANTLTAVLEPISKATTGYLARGSNAADSEATRMKDAQSAMDKRLALKEERLRKQFTGLETALGSSRSQIAWIQGQIGGLPSWG